MFNGIKKRLEWKLLFYFLLFMAVFSAVMGGATYYNAAKRRSSEMLLYDTHGRTLIRSFAADVMFGLLSQDTETMAGRVDLLFKDPTVSYALIYNDKGEPAYARYREKIKPKSIKLPKPSSGAAAGVSAGSLRSSAGIEFLDLTAPVGESEGGAADPGGASSIGWVRIGMSLEAPNREIRASWLVNLLLILVVVAGGVAFIYFSIRMIMAPVERLVEAARRVGEGEFGVQVEVTSEDQVGLLAGTFNRMSVNIKQQTKRTEELIINIAMAVNLLTETITHLLSVTSEQSAGTSEQASVIEEVTSTAEEMAVTANKISESAGSASQSAKKTSEAANQGNELMEIAVSAIEKIMNQVGKVTAQLNELAQNAQTIGGITGIIEEINEQANMLSLNAQIEAVGAGQAGKRFGAVATEVGHLAKRTLDSANSITKMVGAIQNSTHTLVVLTEDMSEVVNEGVESVRKMGEYFQHILEMVDGTSQSTTEIGVITHQQSDASQQMVQSMAEVEKAAREVENGVKEIESSLTGLDELAKTLLGLIGEGDKKLVAM